MNLQHFIPLSLRVPAEHRSKLYPREGNKIKSGTGPGLIQEGQGLYFSRTEHIKNTRIVLAYFVYMEQIEKYANFVAVFCSHGMQEKYTNCIGIFHSQGQYYALINRARGPYKEIFVLTFKAYGPNEVRSMCLECQNKYFPYGPKSRFKGTSGRTKSLAQMKEREKGKKNEPSPTSIRQMVL